MCCIQLNQTVEESHFIKSKCPQSETLSFNMMCLCVAMKTEGEAPNPLFLPVPLLG